MNMVLSAPALGGALAVASLSPLRFQLAGKEDLCLVVLLKVRIFAVLFPPEAVGYLVAGRLYCFINVAKNSLNASFCPQLVPNFC